MSPACLLQEVCWTTLELRITSRPIVLPQPCHNLVHRCWSGGTPTPRNQRAQSVLLIASTNIQANNGLSQQSTKSLIGTDQEIVPFGSDREGLTDDDIKLQPPPPKKVKNTRVRSACNIEKKGSRFSNLVIYISSSTSLLINHSQMLWVSSMFMLWMHSKRPVMSCALTWKLIQSSLDW